MDPLSIATGAASLAMTAKNISLWLINVIDDVRNVNRKILDLSNEVTILKTLLSSMEKTVAKCQSQVLTLAHLDEDMWVKIGKTLADCRITLEDLDNLIRRISPEHATEGGSSSNIFKKSGTYIYLNRFDKDIISFANKVYKSNCAMQTALSVIHLSLTLRTNESQENIFHELQTLRGLVEEALKTSNNDGEPDSEDPKAALQARNLERLAKAAQRFHAAASTTASTRYHAEPNANWGGSEVGDLNDEQRERIQHWTEMETVEEIPEDNTTKVTYVNGSSATVSNPDPIDASGLETEYSSNNSRSRELSKAEYEMGCNWIEIANKSFLAADYEKAAQFLKEIGDRFSGAMSPRDYKLLMGKLAICYALQCKWYQVTKIVESMRRVISDHILQAPNRAGIPVASDTLFFDKEEVSLFLAKLQDHLLLAISLAYLEVGDLEGAYSVSKAVYQDNHFWDHTNAEYHVCSWIFLLACESKKNTLEAETIRHSTGVFKYQAATKFLSSKQYIQNLDEYLDILFSIYRTRSLDKLVKSGTFRGSGSSKTKGKILRRVQTLRGHEGRVRSIVFALNGQLLISGSDDATIRMWEVDVNGRMWLTQKNEYSGAAEMLAYSEHSHKLAAIINGAPSVLLHDLSLYTGTEKQKVEWLKEPPSKSTGFTSVTFTPRNKIAAGRGTGEVVVWQVDSTSRIIFSKTIPSHTSMAIPITSVCALSKESGTYAHGDWVMSSSLNGLICGHDDDSCRCPHYKKLSAQANYTLKTSACLSIAASSGEKYFVSGHVDHKLRLWKHPTRVLRYQICYCYNLKAQDSDKLLEPQELEGHAGSVCSVAVSKDGRYIASGSEDMTVRLWKADWKGKFREVDRFDGHTGTVCSVAFSPDSKRLASASADHTIRIFDIVS